MPTASSSTAQFDTDTQIAILASLLEPAAFPISELRDALTGARGDVGAAAESLLLPRVKSAGKRRAGTTLQSWLGKKRSGGGGDGVGRVKEAAEAVKAVGADTPVGAVEIVELDNDEGDRRPERSEGEGKGAVGVAGGAVETIKLDSEEGEHKPKRSKGEGARQVGEAGGAFEIIELDDDEGFHEGSTNNAEATPSTATAIAHTKPANPAKPTQRCQPKLRNAFTLLHAPRSPVKPKTTPQPAVLLASQSAIDQHRLPLTLLQSPLSPALASALFLAMMQESQVWERHRWFLAGRWVESPHTSANYYREGGGYGAGVGGATDKEDGEGERGAEGKYYYSGNELWPPKVRCVQGAQQG